MTSFRSNSEGCRAPQGADSRSLWQLQALQARTKYVPAPGVTQPKSRRAAVAGDVDSAGLQVSPTPHTMPWVLSFAAAVAPGSEGRT